MSDVSSVVWVVFKPHLVWKQVHRHLVWYCCTAVLYHSKCKHITSQHNGMNYRPGLRLNFKPNKAMFLFCDPYKVESWEMKIFSF